MAYRRAVNYCSRHVDGDAAKLTDEELQLIRTNLKFFTKFKRDYSDNSRILIYKAAVKQPSEFGERQSFEDVYRTANLEKVCGRKTKSIPIYKEAVKMSSEFGRKQAFDEIYRTTDPEKVCRRKTRTKYVEGEETQGQDKVC